MNLKVVLIGLVLTIALIAGGVWGISAMQSPPAPVNSQNTGQLEAMETKYDFGKISMAKGKVTKAFSVKNTDTKTATVTKLFSSCMCTTATLVAGDKKVGPFGMPGHGVIPQISVEIPPGETADVKVEFDPAAHGPAGIGLVQRTVTLELNGQSPLTFSFSAAVTP